MKFYDRYCNGETIAVYHDIAALEQQAFAPAFWKDIEKVLIETFQRVSYNLNEIYSELTVHSYCFWKDHHGHSEAIATPSKNIDHLLRKIDAAIHPFGYVPMSLQYFYKFAGACNFAWDYNQNARILWEMADPIQIIPAHQLLEEVSDEGRREMAEEDKEEGFAVIELSADSLHKDNISGGPPYSLELTSSPSIDARLIHEPNNTSFINYLRLCFEHCGFPGMAGQADQNGFQAFCQKVKPRLQEI